jgi:two-component system chemotaxis response regulator CheB
LTELTKIRVVVVDDSAFIRQVIRHALISEPDISVVGWACDGLAALEEVARLEPDVITLDCEMPVCGGEEVLATLRALPAPPAVVMVTGIDTEVQRLVADGAFAVIAKSSSSTLEMPQLIRAVRAAARARTHRAPPPIAMGESGEPVGRR